MATGSNVSLSCRQHQQEFCKFFCKQCRECICLSCVDEEHSDHTFCRLQSAEEDIRKELQRIIQDLNDKSVENVYTFKELIDKNRENIDVWKAELKDQIDTHAEKMIASVNLSREKTHSDLETIFTGISEARELLHQRLEALTVQMSDKNIQELEFCDVVRILLDIKSTVSSIKDFVATTNKPSFTKIDSNLSVGHLESNRMKPNPSFAQGTSVKKTEASTNTDTMQSIFEESSFNITECTEDPSPLTISHDALKNVAKIVATTKDNAWILANNTLRKIQSNILEGKVYADDVLDFEVLSECIIFLFNNFQFRRIIQKCTPSGRILPFADVGESFYPCCISVKNRQVFVYEYYLELFAGAHEVFSKIEIYTEDGLKISEIKNQPPFMAKFSPARVIPCSDETRHYLLFRTYGEYKQSSLVLMKNNKKEIISQYRFCGVIGSCPEKSFVCGGACWDKNEKMLVVDQTYKCIYALGKDLNYKETFLKNTDFNLTCPMAVTVDFDVLWLADVGKIYKFKYDSDKKILFQ